MTRTTISQTLPAGHVLVPAAAIGGLSVILAAGLQVLGVLDRTNAAIGSGFGGGLSRSLPSWVLWAATVFFAFALAYAVLSTPGPWRRAVLWITSMVLIGTWAPVLVLAAYAPDISAPCIATIWSGVCALVYAANHRMACDEPHNTP